MKTVVEKMGCLERPIYYLSNDGNNFYQIPSKDFFRKYYDDIEIQFDYHVKFDNDSFDENNDFNIKIKLLLNKKELIFMDIFIKFSGGEFSGKLSAKFKYEIPIDFNYLISKMNKTED